MSVPRTVGLYRVLVRLYPRTFRDEYGADMVQLFAHQLRDESAARAWSRGVVDLAITVPTRHLEAHMNRAPSALVPLLYTLFGVAGLLLAIVGGSSIGTLVIGLAIAVIGGVLAVASWRRIRPAARRGVTAQWWKLVAGGVVALAAMTLAEEATDLSLWYAMVITILFALVAIVTGLVLGVVHLIAPARRGTAI